jgi:serine/threonine protein kinase
LKSLNIFLKQGKDVPVGDLGVAKVLNQTFFAKTFIGTPYYLSPEICEDKPYNDKSDVWALGCILYELCTYHHPFTAKSQGGLILKILNENPKPINDYYSKELKHLIKVIFNKDYQKRPSCLDILKLDYVIEKAKHFGIYEDIKNSFPEIEKIENTSSSNDKVSINKVNINKLGVHHKPIVITNIKNNNNKKRPASGIGLFGRIKNSNLGLGGIKKKNDNLGGINIPLNNNNKKVVIHKKNIKFLSNNKNNKGSNIKSNAVRKKVICSAKKELFLRAEKFEKNSNINLIKDSSNKNNNKPIPLKKIENDNHWINTKDLNKICNEKSTIKEQTNTNTNTNIDNKKSINDNKNDNNKNNDNKNNEQKGTINNNKLNYSIDSKHNAEINDKDINIDFEKTKDNNNFSIESDIYMTAKRDQYQPQSKQKEEKKEQKEEEKKTDNNVNKFEIEGSLPLMQTKEFNDLLSDFDTKKDVTINDFKIIDNNNEEIKEEKGKNIDNNKSISSGEEEKDNNKYFSDDDKANEEEDAEEVEKVVEIDNNENAEENIVADKEEIEENKANLKKELESTKKDIDRLKEELPKIIGEEKYEYVMKIVSIGAKDGSKQEEVNEKIVQFIKDNIKNNNEEKLFDIMKLFILECQYYKKQEMLNKL